jgi:putative ABC transport system permease protein
VIALLALVIGAIAVTNTMAMAVLQRRRELALLSAIGWSHRQIATLILGEGVVVGLLGAGTGLVIGVAASHLLVSLLAASDFVTPEVTAWGLGRGLLVGLAIGILGGLYPAWRVTRLPPAALLGRF